MEEVSIIGIDLAKEQFPGTRGEGPTGRWGTARS